MSRTASIPFEERNSPARGLLDLACGCYPRFLFGGSTGDCLPVFHFHEAHPTSLEPYFRHLAENGYRTVQSEELAALALRGQHPGPRSVALCFDDAWSSLWVVAAPLLRCYGLKAITFVSPFRTVDGDSPRPAWSGSGPTEQPLLRLDRDEPMFATWPELRALNNEGLVDIQAHSWRHAKVAAHALPCGFVAPGTRMHPHEVPLLDAPDGLRFACREDLGAPLYPTRSRYSDALRWVAPEATRRCMDWVLEHGGPSFFDQPDWERSLHGCMVSSTPGRWETAEERDAAIRDDLTRCSEELEARMGKPIRHLCFPWAVAGKSAVRIARECGYETAFSDRLGGFRAVRAGDPPHQLMRLKHSWITCLPGKGRSWFFGHRLPGASQGLDLADPPLPARPAEAP